MNWESNSPLESSRSQPVSSSNAHHPNRMTRTSQNGSNQEQEFAYGSNDYNFSRHVPQQYNSSSDTNHSYPPMPNTNNLTTTTTTTTATTSTTPTPIISNSEQNIFEALLFQNEEENWQDAMLQSQSTPVSSPRMGFSRFMEGTARGAPSAAASSSLATTSSHPSHQDSIVPSLGSQLDRRIHSQQQALPSQQDDVLENQRRPDLQRFYSVPGTRFFQDPPSPSTSDNHQPHHPQTRRNTISPQIQPSRPLLPSSRLHDAARICNWTEVITLSQNHPHLATYIGENGSMALHHACSRRPKNPKVIEHLLKAHPDALLAQDQKGWNPLHYACRFKASLTIFRILLEMYPKRARLALKMKEFVDHRKPLFFAVRYDAPDGVIEMLLDVDVDVTSSVLEVDRKGESPLSRLWTNYREMPIGKKMVEKYKNKVLKGEKISLVVDTPFEKVWKKVEFLLQYAWKRNYSMYNGDDGKRTSMVQDWKVLFAICSIQCHVTLFYIALGLYPEQLTQQHAVSGRTALHCAAMSPGTGEGALAVIHHILQHFPKACQIKDSVDESLPLHCIAENGNKNHWLLHGVCDIYKSYPEAICQRDSLGRLPLHRACISLSKIYDNIHMAHRRIDPYVSVILQLYDHYPQAVKERDNLGQLPLHYCVSHGVYWDKDLQKLCKAYPNAMMIRNTSGQLPLHCAASNPNSSYGLILTCLNMHKRGAQMMDGEGKLPLHLVCQVGIGGRAEETNTYTTTTASMRTTSTITAAATHTIVRWNSYGPKLQLLYDAYPASLNMPDQTRKGWTPLHHACASPAVTVTGKSTQKFNLIQQLVTLNPDIAKEMVQTKDRFGRYPLHLACSSGKQWKEGVEQLFELFPLACISVDDFGLLPWHCAALSGAEMVVADTGNDEEEDPPKEGEGKWKNGENEKEEDEAQEMDMLESNKALEKVNTLFELLIGNPSTVKSYKQ